MKKSIAFFIAVFIVCSCSQDVRTNTPGFQASKNSALWQGLTVKATVFSGTATGLLIEAEGEDGTVSIQTTGLALGTYYLGTGITGIESGNFATHTSTKTGAAVTYTTAPLVGPVASIASPLVFSGNAYTASNSAATTGGTGSGLTVKTEVSQGSVTKVSILSPGNNYTPGDIVTIVGGNNYAQFVVQNVEGSNGEITITDISNGTVTGTFKFNAKSSAPVPNGSEFVSFQNGNFYKVPVN